MCSQKMSWKGHFLIFCSFFSVLANTREHWVSLNRALIRCDKAHICGMIDCSITFIIVLESAKIHLTMKERTKRKPFIFHGFTQKIFGFISMKTCLLIDRNFSNIVNSLYFFLPCKPFHFDLLITAKYICKDNINCYKYFSRNTSASNSRTFFVGLLYFLCVSFSFMLDILIGMQKKIAYAACDYTYL